MGRKHIPQRTCIECRTTRPKRELIRIVRLAEDGVTIDETGKKSGRGAYLCRCKACWEGALSCGRLEHALKTFLTDEEKGRLRAFADALSGAKELEDMQARTGAAAERRR